MWLSWSGPVCDECQTTYWSGSMPMPQPSTMASKFRFLMCSFRNAAHAQLAQLRLHDLGDLLALVVALVRQQLEGERLAVAHEESVLVAMRPARLGEQAPGLVHVVRVGLHLVREGPRPRLVRAGRLAREADAHAVDDLALVDGVGERLTHAPVREARIAEVEAEVRVTVAGVPELRIGALERAILRLAAVLERGQRGGVDASRLQLEERRGLARDDAVHDPRDVGTPLPVVGVRHEHDLLARAQLLEPVRPRADGSRPVLRRLADAALAHVRLEQVLGQHRRGPVRERLREGLAVVDAHDARAL